MILSTVLGCNKPNETKFFKVIDSFSKITSNDKFIGLSYKDSSDIEIVLIDYKDSNNITQTTSTCLDTLNSRFALISNKLNIQLTTIKDVLKNLREINCNKIYRDDWTTDRFLLESKSTKLLGFCSYSYQVFTRHLDTNEQGQLENNGWTGYGDRIWGKYDCGAID